MISARSRGWLIKTALLVGFVVTFLGVRKIGFPNYSPLLWDSFPSHIFFMLIFGASVAAISKFAKTHLIWAGLAVLSVVTFLGGSLWPLIALAGIFAAFFSLGRIVLTRFSANYVGVSPLSTTIVGAAIYGTAVSVSAQFAVNYTPIYAIALLLPIYIRRKDLGDLFTQARTLLASISIRENLVSLATIAVGIFYLAVAMMPETGFDALAIHLYVPARLTHDHIWAFDPDKYVWALMPMFADWLFSIAYMIAGETCTRMLNVAFIFVVCAYIRDFVLWFGGNRKGAGWAVLLFLSMPLAFTESASLFVDTVWTTFVLAAVFHTCRAIQKNSVNDLDILLGGLFWGAAMAGKAVTFMILPPMFLILVFGLKRISNFRMTALGLGFFLFGSIPYIRSYLTSGNPVFPFYNHIFKSIYYLPIAFDAPAVFTKGVSWDVLYRITFESGSYLESRNGAAGFAWLLLLVPSCFVVVFEKHRRALAVLFIAGISVFLTFHSTAYLRYVLPSFALLATVIGYAYTPLSKFVPKYPRLIPVFAIVALVLNIIFLNSSTFYGELNVEPLTGESGRYSYLMRKVPVRNAVDTLNGLNRDNAAVGFFANPEAAGLKADAYYVNWYNFRFSHLINTSQTPAETAEVLIASGIEYTVLDSNWSLADVRKKVEAATSSIWTRGSISIRKVKDDYYFKTELMKNPDFATTAGWAPAAKAYAQRPGAIEITDDTPAFQVSKTEPKRRYRQTVVVQCEKKPASGRLQVDWQDAASKPLRSDSRAFDCSADQTTHTMDIVAPDESVQAIVYAVATSNAPVTFRRVSFTK